MAGEYYRWLARDVKPEEKRELTPEEKRRNWWHYHKWHVVIGVVVLLLAVNLGMDVLTDYMSAPDYSVAYVGSSYLPEDTADQLAEVLAQLGEDLNGRGGVHVAVHQYIIYPAEGADLSAGSMNQTMLYTAQVQLVADLENCTSFFFLMEDPEQFQADYQVLAYPDGTLPGDGEENAQPLYYLWTDCPVLRELPLGDFAVEDFAMTYTGSSQDVLSGLYIARRGFEENRIPEGYEGCEALWNRLTEDAAS